MMKNIMVALFFVALLLGCVEKPKEPVKPVVITVTTTECLWVKPILLSKKSVELLRPSVDDPTVKADIVAILKHNTLYDTYCKKADVKP